MISPEKTEAMTLNIPKPLPVQVNGEEWPEEFTYLGNTFRCDGGAGNDVKNRLSKATNAFRILNNFWRSQQ